MGQHNESVLARKDADWKVRVVHQAGGGISSCCVVGPLNNQLSTASHHQADGLLLIVAQLINAAESRAVHSLWSTVCCRIIRQGSLQHKARPGLGTVNALNLSDAMDWKLKPAWLGLTSCMASVDCHVTRMPRIALHTARMGWHAAM